jgi:hypothetical protein
MKDLILREGSLQGSLSLQELKSSSRKEIDDMKNLLVKFNELPDVLSDAHMTSYQEIDQEVRQVEKYCDLNRKKAEKEIFKLFEVQKGKKLQAVVGYYDVTLEGYSNFAIVHPEIEGLLHNLATLVRANCLLEGTGFKGGKRDLTIWEGTYNDVKNLHEFYSKKTKNVKDSISTAMESAITSAKGFVMKVHEIKNSVNSEKLWTMSEIDELIASEKKVAKEIDLSETVEFLTNLRQEINNKHDLVNEEAQVSYDDLLAAKEFFLSLPMDFTAELTTINQKFSDAENFISKIKEMDSRTLQKSFADLMIEYDGLSVKMVYFDELVSKFNQYGEFVTEIESFLVNYTDEATSFCLEDYKKAQALKESLVKPSIFDFSNVLVKMTVFEGRVIRFFKEKFVEATKPAEATVVEAEETAEVKADATDAEETKGDSEIINELELESEPTKAETQEEELKEELVESKAGV